MKYGNVQVLDGSYPLCGTSIVQLPLNLGTVILHGLNCPQSPGVKVSLTETVQFPVDSPLGEYTAKLIAYDQSKQELLCVDLYVEVSSG